MAKKATGTRGASKPSATKSRSRSVTVSERRSGDGGRRSDDAGMGEAFIKLLQSPLVAELVAVAATAALAALAESGFTSSSGASRSGRAGKAVKAAGKAAAAAVGRRLGTEIDEIRKAATTAKDGARA